MHHICPSMSWPTYWTSCLDKLRVQEVMTKDVVTVRGTTSLLEAGQIFLQKKFGCLPVVRDNSRREGIITVTDLLRAYVEQHDEAGRRG